jgi:catechol 2,3-dioxygenase-like lactoylglutathione lyase family enzyme
MRRRSLGILSLLALALSVWNVSAWAQAQPQNRSASSAQVVAVGPIQMTVADMDRSVDFYSRVLTFEKTSDTEIAGENVEHLFGVFGARVRVVRMKLGDESIELVQFLAPRGRAIPADSRSNDLWFQHIAIIVSDMDRAYQVLRENRVEHASTGPQRLPDWNKNAAGIKAFYFKDPDGHPVEILEFPEDKGALKWHRPSGRLFLGIDHTAIAVSNTESSLNFYRDILGMRVAGESENYGTEQEHLNNVFGARLRITALRAAAGPGIEFLEYLTPRDGRPIPADERANDIVHRETILIALDVEAAAQNFSANKTRFVSSGLVVNPIQQSGTRKAFIVRDPDGHAIEIAAE